MRHGPYVFLLALIAMPAANSIESADSAPITLDQVIVNLLERSPQIGINDVESRAAAARLRRSQQTTPYELKLDLENFAGTGDTRGIDRLETTISLIKTLEPRNAVTARGDLAETEVTLLHNKQDSQRLDLLAESTGRFIHLVVDQHRLQIAEQQLKLADQTHRLVKQRVDAGRNHIAESRRTEIELSRAEIDREHAEHELAVSRLRLAITWGETHPQFGKAEAPLFVLPPLASFARLETLLANNPELIRFATEARVAQARLVVARSRSKPKLAFAAGVRYLNDPDDAALVFSMAIPLGTAARAGPEIDEMQSLAEREPLRQEQKRLALYSSLYEIHQELLHSRTAFEALTERIIPLAEQTARDYRQGYEQGRFSLLELNEAQKTLLSARLEQLVVAENYHRFRIEIERLTGTYLGPGEQP